MTILDQPIAEEESAPVQRGWTWFEKIFAALVIVVTLVREMFGMLLFETVMLLTCFVALSYLLGYYWMEKPSARTPRTVVITILYGFSFSAGIFAFIFQILFIIGSGEMTILAGVIFSIIVIIDFATAPRRMSVANSRTLVRAAVLGTFLIILFLIPESKHIEFTYRKFPDFLNYYREHKEKGEVMRLWDEYTRTRPSTR